MGAQLLSPRLGRILFAEDFDAPHAPATPSVPEPEVIAPHFTLQDLEAAREQALEEGIALGRAREAQANESSQARAVRDALERIAASLAEARAAAESLAEEAAEEIARLALGVLACALPALCAAHGEAELRALTRSLLPTLATEPRVVVRANAAHVAALRQEIAGLGPDMAEKVQVVAAEGMPAGDLRVSWNAGSATRSTAALHAAIKASLESLGLLPGQEQLMETEAGHVV